MIALAAVFQPQGAASVRAADSVGDSSFELCGPDWYPSPSGGNDDCLQWAQVCVYERYQYDPNPPVYILLYCYYKCEAWPEV